MKCLRIGDVDGQNIFVDTISDCIVRTPVRRIAVRSLRRAPRLIRAPPDRHVDFRSIFLSESTSCAVLSLGRHARAGLFETHPDGSA
jgi:hypothetical protein